MAERWLVLGLWWELQKINAAFAVAKVALLILRLVRVMSPHAAISIYRAMANGYRDGMKVAKAP